MLDSLPQSQPSAPPSGLDPQLVTLAKAIRQTESQGNFQAQGKSGEFGAYQFMPSTWQATAPKYGVSTPLEQATPQQQNEVAYKQLAEWKQQHPDWNVGNFASAWNAGPGKPNAYLEGNAGTNAQGVKYDTAAYAQNVATNYQQFKGQAGTPSPYQLTQNQPAPDPSPSVGGFLGNVVQSGANFLGNIGQAALHPIQTVQNIGGAAVGGLQELGGQQNDNTAKFDNIVNFFKQRYGSLDQLEHTVYTDPVGFAADLSTVFAGGAGLAGVAAKGADIAGVADAANVARTIGGVANKAADLTNPLTPVISGIGSALSSKTAQTVGETLTSKVTGLEPVTIQTIVRDPQAFTADAIAEASRKPIAEEVLSALQKQEDTLSETGKAYAPIRNADTPLAVSKSFLEKQFEDVAGVTVARDGKIVSTLDSKIRDTRDVAALQDLYNKAKPFFSRGALSPNQYLNFRTDLAKLSKFGRDIGKSDALEAVARQIRHNFNDKYRGNIGGLQELDSSYETHSNTYDTLKEGLLKRNGEPVANVINKIARSIGTGKDEMLARLEQLVPGITQRLKVQSAMEDIAKASGNKVGTYTKSTLEVSGVVIGGLTGSIHILAASIAAMIIATPEVAVPILKVFGMKKDLVSEVMGRLARYSTVGATSDRAVNDQTEALPTTPDTAPQTMPDTQVSASPNPTPAQ